MDSAEDMTSPVPQGVVRPQRGMRGCAGEARHGHDCVPRRRVGRRPVPPAAARGVGDPAGGRRGPPAAFGRGASANGGGDVAAAAGGGAARVGGAGRPHR